MALSAFTSKLFTLGKEKLLERHDYNRIEIILFEVLNSDDLKKNSDQSIPESLLTNLKELLNKKIKAYIKNGLLTVNYFSNHIIIYMINDELVFQEYSLKRRANFLKQTLENTVNEQLLLSNRKKYIFRVACTYIVPKPQSNINELMFLGLEQVLQINKHSYNQENEATRKRIQEIINQGDVTTLYQPIVDIQQGTILAYEALSRGPEGTNYFSPAVLFPTAEKVGLLYPMEKLTRTKAIKRFARYTGAEKLFININPEIIQDPNFCSGYTKEILEEAGLLPQNIVFEITERTSIKDFKVFKKALKHYRNQGFKVAIDDAGAGYSSLEAIAELHPDFIKLDRSLIKDIDKNSIKQALLETFITFTSKINSSLIAEGIETQEELYQLHMMGITYGQGYVLAKPHNPPPQIIDTAKVLLRKLMTKETKFYGSDSIGNLSTLIKCMDSQMPAYELANYFNQNEYVKGVVILDKEVPIGLVMRDKLFSRLAKQYGVALYWNKPLIDVMDSNPLILDYKVSIKIAMQLALNRSSKKLYDFLIVTKNKKYIGVVPIEKILNAYANN